MFEVDNFGTKITEIIDQGSLSISRMVPSEWNSVWKWPLYLVAEEMGSDGIWWIRCPTVFNTCVFLSNKCKEIEMQRSFLIIVYFFLVNACVFVHVCSKNVH